MSVLTHSVGRINPQNNYNNKQQAKQKRKKKVERGKVVYTFEGWIQGECK